MKRIMLLLVVLLLAACGDGTISADASPYQLLVASSDLAVGQSRLALTLWDGPERLTGVQEMDVALFKLNDEGETSDKVWEGKATSYQMQETEYWVSYPEFPEAGYYGVQTLFTTADGKRVENRALMEAKAEPEAPAVGESVPPSQTRTLDDAPIEELSSGAPYVEDFYRMTVAEAIEAGKPAIIAFVTPGFCSSSLCEPVLQSVATASETLGDEVNVVHVEIYRDFANNVMDPAVTEWKLPSEPWVFVLNADGTVGKRLDGLVGPTELVDAVRAVQSGQGG